MSRAPKALVMLWQGIYKQFPVLGPGDRSQVVSVPIVTEHPELTVGLFMKMPAELNALARAPRAVTAETNLPWSNTFLSDEQVAIMIVMKM
jgi:hypothetical protein